MGLALSLESLETPKASKKVNTDIVSMEFVEAMLHLNTASEELNDAFVQCGNGLATITNMQAIRSSVEQFGITDALFSLVDRESLSTCLGVTIPEKITKSNAKAVAASIEAATDAGWFKRMVDRVVEFFKNMWNKFTRFVAWVFKTNMAKARIIGGLLRSVDISKIESVEELNAPKAAEFNKVVKDMSSVATMLAGPKHTSFTETFSIPESETGTAQALGWNKQTLKDAAIDVMNALKDGGVGKQAAAGSETTIKAGIQAAKLSKDEAELADAKKKLEEAKEHTKKVSELLKASSKAGNIVIYLLRKCKSVKTAEAAPAQ